MQTYDPDQERPVKEHTKQSFVQKIEALQERVRKLGVISVSSNEKAFMDEGWISYSGNPENRLIKMLDDPTSPDLDSKEFGGCR